MRAARLLLLALLILTAAPGSMAVAQVEVDWMAICTGTGVATDEPVGIGLDATGGCYIAGRSYNSITDWEFVAVKYTDGVVNWERRYRRPADSADYATDMVVAPDGQVFVTGLAHAAGDWNPDILTVAFTSDGDTAWARHCGINLQSSPLHLVRSPDGSVAVAWTGGDPQGFGLLKYTSDGDSLWSSLYSRPNMSQAQCQGVICDSDGNFVLTGGIGDWTQYDVLTVKVSPDGDTLWGRTYAGPAGGYDEGSAAITDPDGNVYVAARVVNSGWASDIAVLKYSPEGALLWERSYDGTAHNVDEPRAILLDHQGNICVAGEAQSATTGVDVFIHKYSPDGDSLWATLVTNEYIDYETPWYMAQDGSGNIYLAGTFDDLFGTGKDFLTLKLSGSSGVALWQDIYSESDVDSRPAGMAVANEDHVYVTGSSDPPDLPDCGLDIRTIKYRPVASAVFEEQSSEPPTEFRIGQNAPNPFNQSTTIPLSLDRASRVELDIYNAMGQLVLRHVESDLSPGTYTFAWDGVDQRGREVASGIYVYRVTTGRSAQSRKMVLLK